MLVLLLVVAIVVGVEQQLMELFDLQVLILVLIVVFDLLDVVIRLVVLVLRVHIEDK